MAKIGGPKKDFHALGKGRSMKLADNLSATRAKAYLGPGPSHNDMRKRKEAIRMASDEWTRLAEGERQSLMNDVYGCPWCFNRVRGLSVPRPQKCVDTA